MLIKNLISTALIFRVCNGFENDLEKNNDDFDVIIQEESPWEAKLSSDLTNFKTKSMGILNNIDRKIPDNLEDIHRKLEALEKKIPENLEANLENVRWKLQEYIDQKLSTLERRIYHKIDALEQLKTDTNTINHKLDALKNIQLNLISNNTCESKPVANETPTKIEEMLNKKIVALEVSVINITNANAYAISEICYKNLTYHEENIKNISLDMQIIKRKLDVMDKKIPEGNETKGSLKLDNLDKKIVDLKDNVIHEWRTLRSSIKNTLDNDLNEMSKKIPKLENSIVKKIEAMQVLEQTVLKEIYKTECKMQISESRYFNSPFVRLDNESLNHIVYKNDLSKGTFYLNMHFAVKSDPKVLPVVVLSREPTYQTKNGYLNYLISTARTKLFKQDKTIINKNISTGLSATQYTAFYIKIDNGSLEFGKKGSSTPLIIHSDPDLKEIQYFNVAGDDGNIATFLYDCPPNVNLG